MPHPTLGYWLKGLHKQEEAVPEVKVFPLKGKHRCVLGAVWSPYSGRVKGHINTTLHCMLLANKEAPGEVRTTDEEVQGGDKVKENHHQREERPEGKTPKFKV